MSSISIVSCYRAIIASLTLSVACAVIAVPAMGAESDSMRQYQLEKDGSVYRLNMKAIPEPKPGNGEVLVRVRATSLNRRDLLLTAGQYGFGGDYNGRVPVSDGAGDVIAVGPGVTQFEVGDRVAATFFANWPGGRRTIEGMSSSRGGQVDGMLSEMVVSHEDGLISIPDHLSYEEAATLPCAAITAWVALFTGGQLKSDQIVLLEGTGGVSIFGLQFATAAGAKVIITSSSDIKCLTSAPVGQMELIV